MPAVLGAAAMIAITTWVVLAILRVGHPFELEWQEGGMLEHLRRVRRGEADRPHTGSDGSLDTRDRIFDHQTVCRWDPKALRSQQKQIGCRFSMGHFGRTANHLEIVGDSDLLNGKADAFRAA